MVGILKPDLKRHIFDGNVGCQQQICGFIEFQSHQVLTGGDMAVSFEEGGQVPNINAADISNLAGGFDGRKMSVDIPFTVLIGLRGSGWMHFGVDRCGGLFQKKYPQITAADFLGEFRLFVTGVQDFMEQVQGFVGVGCFNEMPGVQRAFFEQIIRFVADERGKDMFHRVFGVRLIAMCGSRFESGENTRSQRVNL